MNIKLQKEKLTLFQMREVEVTELTAEEAIKTLDLFLETLYDAVTDTGMQEDKWTDILRHMRAYANDACNSCNV
jgi:hypothetical protein